MSGGKDSATDGKNRTGEKVIIFARLAPTPQKA